MIDDMLDIVMLVLCLAIGSACSAYSLNGINKTLDTYNTGDKIALTSYVESSPEESVYTTGDIMLMTVIADKYQPYPKNMQINNTTLITFNDGYFLDTNTAINNIWYGTLSSLADKYIEDFTISHEGGIVRWQISTN